MGVTIIGERTIFMWNPKITSLIDNTEQVTFPLSPEEGTRVPLPKKASPTFIPNNQQGFAIFDIQDLVLANNRITERLIGSAPTT